MKPGLFQDLLGEPLTTNESAHYRKITADLQAAMANFEAELADLHKRVMDRRTAEHQPAKVLTMKPKGE